MSRDVQDANHITWSCVQAFAGLGDSAAATEAAARVAEEPGTLAVVCTPSGGAETVRLALAPDWETSISDADLLAAITAGLASS